MRKTLAGLICLIVLCGCVQTPYLYYGNSSHYYYRAVKNQDDASIEKYKESLEKVFLQSARKNLKIPPGLCCDYAMLLIREDNIPLAKTYFSKEISNWPESEKMVEFLKNRYNIE